MRSIRTLRARGAALLATGVLGAAVVAAWSAGGPAQAAPMPAAPAATKPLVTFKVLFLLYPHVRVPGQPAYDMSQQMIDAARTAATVTWPGEVSTYTGGQVAVLPTFVIPDHTLTSNEKYRAGNNADVWPNVWPDDVPQDVTRYVQPAGRYDSVIAWDAHDGYHNTTSGAGANETTAHVTWSTQGHPAGPADYGPGTDMLAGTKHEWLHGLSSYYFRDKGLGARSPQCGADNPDGLDGVHCGEEYGYAAAQNGLDHWNAWYKDYFNGAIAGGTKGLGPVAWAKGVPRARYGGPLDGSDGTTPPPPTPTGKTLVGAGSKRCLDVDHALTADGTAILIYDCHGEANQQWRIDGGRLVNSATGKCLAPRDNGTTDGTRVWQWTCNPTEPFQQWTLRADGTLRNPSTGKCLDVAKKATANGALVQLWGCNPNATTGANQRWAWQS